MTVGTLVRPEGCTVTDLASRADHTGTLCPSILVHARRTGLLVGRMGTCRTAMPKFALIWCNLTGQGVLFVGVVSRQWFDAVTQRTQASAIDEGTDWARFQEPSTLRTVVALRAGGCARLIQFAEFSCGAILCTCLVGGIGGRGWAESSCTAGKALGGVFRRVSPCRALDVIRQALRGTSVTCFTREASCRLLTGRGSRLISHVSRLAWHVGTDGASLRS